MQKRLTARFWNDAPETYKFGEKVSFSPSSAKEELYAERVKLYAMSNAPPPKLLQAGPGADWGTRAAFNPLETKCTGEAKAEAAAAKDTKAAKSMLREGRDEAGKCLPALVEEKKANRSLGPSACWLPDLYTNVE